MTNAHAALRIVRYIRAAYEWMQQMGHGDRVLSLQPLPNGEWILVLDGMCITGGDGDRRVEEMTEVQAVDDVMALLDG